METETTSAAAAAAAAASVQTMEDNEEEEFPRLNYVWDMDTERNIKLLLRQRGSHLRKTVDEDNIIVIRTPKRKLPLPSNFRISKQNNPSKLSQQSDLNVQNNILTKESLQLNDAILPSVGTDISIYEDNIPEDPPSIINKHQFQPLFDAHNPLKEKKVNNYNRDVDNFDVDLTRDSHYLPAFDNYKKSIAPNKRKNLNNNKKNTNPFESSFQFQDCKNIDELLVSNMSMTSIGIFKDLFKNLFQDNLVMQAIKDFKMNDHNKIKKMMYKLDLKIFQKLTDMIENDLDDIFDINLANNELCNKISAIQNKKESISSELNIIKKELKDLERNDDGASGNNKQQQNEMHEENYLKSMSDKDDNDKFQLNKKLQELSNMLGNPNINEIVPSSRNNEVDDDREEEQAEHQQQSLLGDIFKTHSSH
ncbi:Ame1p NDAI_0D00780 [Naumovozyma dairenensis CBS 421]|uniref:Inner kinetochore subunit AME1 domain-containing protein n=1 Tax=Naumovozyma dairenensis (strain ATCC 10597 / BCRC 20456 / CBS 421 / NBRC 0211 / NRRL Y-12639) TaxID=1071378 RepID=G0W9D1_NAUDC|nr:hypothetical protein NDAI_0D00780 [Naumovozyma dairenensis CBS 421]CCD24392.1 hypothetical protein NDAI_0D00780 [Naumovozyma dairenensis CBS 421]